MPNHEFMENTKKVIVAVIFWAYTFGFQDAAIAQDLCVFKEGEVFLKTKNYSLHHPSQWKKPWSPSILHSRVYDSENEKYIELGDVVNCSELVRINDSDNYFSDDKHVYVYSFKPHPIQFYFLPSQEVTFEGRGKDYMKYGGKIYYAGTLVDEIQDANVVYFEYFDSITSDETYEFLTDGVNIFIADFIVDEKEDMEERLQFYDMSPEDKNAILDRYF